MDRKAYEAHLETPHFKDYKTTTLKMVKSLKLIIDMKAIDGEAMPLIFKKLSEIKESQQPTTPTTHRYLRLALISYLS